MKKKLFFIFVVAGITFVTMGCSGVLKEIIEIQKTQVEHLTLIHKRIEEYDQTILVLESSVRNLEIRLAESSQKIISVLDNLKSTFEIKLESLEKDTSEIRKKVNNLEKEINMLQLNELENKINMLQEANKNIQSQITKLQSQLSEITKKNFELFF
ncbi:MAG: hypothetical protein ACUBOA_09250 [Candidatus Loosdrechtia sp.]|uniref:hypothetical protein n=1 Tax=Candidatus Loosdrechtia sp. TaxID=3101272 RepID=UPI003A70DC0B|nr:MAG: hypothetical protein QY305_02785 [Candidatus Jettenia sp. AMX2]